MEKYGVVTGVVKTASADNEGDPIGTAAKCIASARESLNGLSEVMTSLRGLRDNPEVVADNVVEDTGED